MEVKIEYKKVNVLSKENEAFILVLMADKGITREQAIDRCISVVRSFVGSRYEPAEAAKFSLLPTSKGDF